MSPAKFAPGIAPGALRTTMDKKEDDQCPRQRELSSSDLIMIDGLNLV